MSYIVKGKDIVLLYKMINITLLVIEIIIRPINGRK